MKKTIFCILLLLNSLSLLCASEEENDFDLSKDAFLLSSSTNPGGIQIWNPLEIIDEDNQMVCEQSVKCTSGEPSFVASFCTEEKCTFVIVLKDEFKIIAAGNENVVTSYPGLVQHSSINEKLREENGRIDALALLQDGQNCTVLCGSKDGYIYEYSAQDGDILRVFEGVQHNKNNTYGITCFAMYEDNGQKYLVSGSANGTVRIYNYDTGAEYRTFETGELAVTSVALFQDATGIYLIAGTTSLYTQGKHAGALFCWNANSGKQVYQAVYGEETSEQDFEWGFINGLVLFYDKTNRQAPIQLATIANDSVVKIWNAKTGCVLTHLHDEKIGTARVSDIKPFEQNGLIKLAAGYSGKADGVVGVWDTQCGALELCQTYESDGGVQLLVLFEVCSNDKIFPYCATAERDGTIAVRSLRTLDLRNLAKVSGMSLQCLATNKELYSNKGKFYVSHDSKLGSGCRVQQFNLNNLRVVTAYN